MGDEIDEVTDKRNDVVRGILRKKLAGKYDQYYDVAEALADDIVLERDLRFELRKAFLAKSGNKLDRQKLIGIINTNLDKVVKRIQIAYRVIDFKDAQIEIQKDVDDEFMDIEVNDGKKSSK